MPGMKKGYKPLPGGGKGSKGKKAVAKPRPGGPGTMKPLPTKKRGR